MILRIFLHIGSNIKPQSKAKTRPAPRENHTENLSVLRPASRTSCICLILKSLLAIIDINLEVQRAVILPSKGKQTPMTSKPKYPEEKSTTENFSLEEAILSTHPEGVIVERGIRLGVSEHKETSNNL